MNYRGAIEIIHLRFKIHWFEEEDTLATEQQPLLFLSDAIFVESKQASGAVSEKAVNIQGWGGGHISKNLDKVESQFTFNGGCERHSSDH